MSTTFFPYATLFQSDAYRETDLPREASRDAGRHHASRLDGPGRDVRRHPAQGREPRRHDRRGHPGRTEHEAVLRGIPPGAPGRWRDVRVRAVPGPDGRGRTDRAG